jgi:flagellar FliL protein
VIVVDAPSITAAIILRRFYFLLTYILAHPLLVMHCKAVMNRKTIILIGAAILGGGASVYFVMPDFLPAFIRPADPAHDRQAKNANEKHEPEVGADLDVFVVNLAGEAPARYLRTTLSFGVHSEKEKQEVKELSGPIRHAVIMYLTERKVEELLDPEGKAKLRSNLLKQINAAVGKKLVSNVYFKEFLIQ